LAQANRVVMAISDLDPLLIAGSYSAEVRFLDAFRGDHRRTLLLQDYTHVNRLVVSPKCAHLAVAGNPQVRCYDLQGSVNAHPICSYEGHKNNVCALGFEAEGKWLYTGSEDATIRVWDCREQKCQLCYENNDKSAIHSVDLHPNQVELIACDNQGKVFVWDLIANRVRRTLIPEEGVPVQSICIAPDARIMVAANHEGTCYVWQSDDSFEVLQKIEAHSAYILKCALSSDSKHLVLASADSTASVWRAHPEGFAWSSTLVGHTKWVWDCVFTCDGQYIATASSDCTCRLWDVRSGTQRLEFSGFSKGVTALALVDRL